ncbi:hypothetical protein HN807_07440 [Candidatus Bathyarchaeota archaeon]|mgnify:FL=1|jgi:hypothetical protein|nr:hypothetical protein [Candidatus Bathyarchaeota archaeon]MBT4320258.1 hypothetical protein [Candidatus Bathyarchaeota archaeon]MBT5641899.1 hypothetical protein [Candidatus Bathyarchaeota archaeon]MBT7185754.1 hypothetical protein [Candidatus Bathyarchaeota archaeon]MBT7346898.1 hypothetical protein [Candidatus Bathyarchaeota archaeon]
MVLSLIVGIIVGSIISAPIVWISGRLIVGAEKAKFMDAVMIGTIATATNIVMVTFIGPLSGILQLIIYLYLVTKYFETGYLRAGIIAVLNVVIGIGITYLVTYIVTELI